MQMIAKEKILIVDDDPVIIEQIIDLINRQSSNYTFFIANNGELALKIAKTRYPDIILTDWEMPICNGIELIRKIKSVNYLKDIPIIMITGINMTSRDLNTAFEAGAIDFISKPIDEIELYARLHSALVLSQAYKNNLEFKNNKIEQDTLILLEKESTMNRVAHKVKILYSHIENKEIITDIYLDIKEELKRKSEINIWSDFEKTFDEVNLEFRSKVLRRCPKITNAELKLCMLMRINLTTSGISLILDQKENTIKVARSRVRKKLNLEKGLNLQTFINQL